MRGQQLEERRAACDVRIIPARAGPTSSHEVLCICPLDHPRSCGANDVNEIKQLIADGSSPLVRGQRSRLELPLVFVRIIPARAGPTTSSDALTVSETDHPRSCGANCVMQRFERVQQGSSPLVRGQLRLFNKINIMVRIIPARAGPTHHTSSGSSRNPDHPRSCGANGGGVYVGYT